MSFFALIPARGGSKGIPRKNLVSLAGKPLIDYTIEAALGSKSISDVTISSENEEILNHASKRRIDTLRRPQEFAQDHSSADEVISHFISSRELGANDTVVYLQPTSPLRNARHIDDAISVYLENKAKTVISMFEPEHHPIKAFKLDEHGKCSGFFSPEAPFMPRQTLPKLYSPNGAIYIFSVQDFLIENKIPRNDIWPYIMPSELSIDIDSPFDLEIAAALLKKDRYET